MRVRRAGGRASLGLVAPIVALALTASAAAAVPTAHVTQVGAAPAGQPLDLVFPLVADESGLGRFATSVSTPGSIHYGQFESIATLSARYGASAATKRKVVAYLHGAGASAIKIDSTGLFAYATVPAGLAQRLFSTPLAQFRTARGARFVAPTSVARVPSGLRGAVTDVIGLNTMPLSNSTGALRASGSARFRAHAASRPTSALPRTGTVSSSACAAGGSAGEIGGDPTTAGFTPNQYLTAYGFDPLHNAGLPRPGRAGRADRDRRLQRFGHQGVRPVLPASTSRPSTASVSGSSTRCRRAASRRSTSRCWTPRRRTSRRSTSTRPSRRRLTRCAR